MASIKQSLENLAATRHRTHSGDAVLLLIAGTLILIGLVVLFSASSAVSFIKFGNSYSIFRHQLEGFFLGLLAFAFFSKVNYQVWQKSAVLLLFMSILLLLLVFIPGLRADWGTSRSWISILGFSVQPSEFVKLSFLLYLSAWLVKRKDKLSGMSEGFGPFMFILGIIIFLMLLQPDFGTLSIIAATSMIIYYIGGGKLKHILAVGLIGIVGLVGMIQVKEYQKNRFRCLIDPDFDSQKICYQINQALIAVGSGGVWGRGLGASRQKFMYLPEVTGDSIFAVIGEEVGFIFSSLIILLYLGLFLRGYMISRDAPDDFGKLVSFGIVSWITIQAVINIGGIINIIPMTGVPLPFVSYGGSAIIASMSAIGVLYNISKATKTA